MVRVQRTGYTTVQRPAEVLGGQEARVSVMLAQTAAPAIVASAGTPCRGAAGTWSGVMRGRGRSDLKFRGRIFAGGRSCQGRFHVTFGGGWVIEDFAVTFSDNRILLKGTRIHTRSGKVAYNLDTLSGALNSDRSAFDGTWADRAAAKGTLAFRRQSVKSVRSICGGLDGTWTGVMKGRTIADHKFSGTIFQLGGSCRGRFKVTFGGSFIEDFDVTISGDSVELKGTKSSPSSYNLDHLKGRLNSSRNTFSGTWTDAKKAKGTLSFTKQ